MTSCVNSFVPNRHVVVVHITEEVELLYAVRPLAADFAVIVVVASGADMDPAQTVVQACIVVETVEVVVGIVVVAV